MGLIEKVTGTIKKFSMLHGGETILIGLSGGPDSVCLTHVLKGISTDWGLKLHALYVDHGLRPDDVKKEMEFCKGITEELGIAFTVKSVDVRTYSKEQGLSIQEAARLLRYEVFDACAYETGASRIALGHNLDDTVETFFMHILRGSGPKGLSAIPPVRGNIIRPLIEMERKEIEKFIDDEKACYIIDVSNLKKDYLRNRLRFSLIPNLRALNPNIIETLSRTIEIFREEDRYIETAVTKVMMRLITRKTVHAIELFLTPLEGMDRVILRRVLRRAVQETKGLRGIGFGHIEDVIELIAKGKPGSRLYLPKGIRAIKQYSTLLLTSEPPVRLGTYSLEPQGEVAIKEAGVLIKASLQETFRCHVDGKTSAIFDADRVSFPLTIRARREGDFFYPYGFGRRKKLQDLFVDEKIPRDERDIIPIVTSKEDIIWVANFRADDRFKAVEGTKRFLLLEMRP